MRERFLSLLYKSERQIQCRISWTWNLRGFPSCICVYSVSVATFYISPGAKGHPHKWEMLDVAKIIRQWCPSHTVMPCRHKDGELCEECDISKSEHVAALRMWQAEDGTLAQACSVLILAYRGAGGGWQVSCLTNGIARPSVDFLPSAQITLSLWKTYIHNS